MERPLELPSGAAQPWEEEGGEASTSVPDRIMAAAKELIARKGPVVTTVRDICDASSSNVAAVHYYFGSKDALVRSVLLAVAEPVNVERKRLLEAAQRRFGSGPLPVSQILEAFLRPLVTAERAVDGGRLFVRTDNHLRAVPDGEYAVFVSTKMDQYAQIFIDALAVTLPQYHRSEVIWRYEFVRGSAMHLLSNCDPLSHKFRILQGMGRMIDLEDDALILRELMMNCLLGITAPAAWTQADIRVE